MFCIIVLENTYASVMMVSNHVCEGKTVRHKLRANAGIIALLLGIITAGIGLTASSLSFAATQPNSDVNNSANTLKVSPVRTDIEIPAGTVKTVDMYVTNLTETPITIRPIENDFVAGDERGTPALILDADKYAPTHSLKRYMTPLADVTIPAKQTSTITVTITVPVDAQPGGYFGAVRFAPTDPNGGGQVNLSASVASLILMTVPGDAVEKLNLTHFDIQQKGTTGTNFRTGEDLSVLLRFENKGSVQEGPTGVVSVKKGDTVVYSTKFNDATPREMVLPDSARRWDIPLKNIEGFGHYTVYGTFSYGAKNQTIEVTKSFWVIPWAVIIGAIVGLILLIILIVAVILGIRRKRNRSSMRSFGNRGSSGSHRIK